MVDILSTSLSGMQAFQRALAMTSHNIANANTPGYNRQVASFSTRVGFGADNVFIGSGTQISNIKRIYDVMLGEQLRTSTTGQARFGTLNTMAGRIDSLLADTDTGLNTSMQSFFNSMQDVANDPASIPGRQALLGEATGIASRFAALDQRLDDLDSEVSQRLSQSVDDINRLASSIAEVNDRIALANGRNGQQPNDLLDQRDHLVRQLSEQISVSTTLQDDGAMNVFIGSGQTLVIGTDARRLSVLGSEFDPTRTTITYEGTGGATRLDTSLTGGNMGGLLEFRASILDPSRQALGQSAVAFAQQLNEQHAAGMDLRGNLGGDFFSVASPTILFSSNNSGTGAASADISDLTQFTGADYVLEFDGAAYELRRVDTNQVIGMSGTGTALDPFVADGISITVSGAPAAGDSLLIRSGQDAANSLRSVITDPQSIAMAAPTRSQASLANIGSGSISASTIVDVSDPALLTSTVIEFTTPNTYSINGAGAFAYIAGDPIVVSGSSVNISGAPSVGDQFTIEANFGASGDNGNGLLLAGIQSVGILDGGTISINENYGRLVSSVGGTTRQIQANLDAQNAVLASAEDAYLSTSGVNLDEEAANLIRLQQAYQASAQVLGVANTLFDSLLNATRR